MHGVCLQDMLQIKVDDIIGVMFGTAEHSEGDLDFLVTLESL
jgi:hypothetical protein